MVGMRCGGGGGMSRRQGACDMGGSGGMRCGGHEMWHEKWGPGGMRYGGQPGGIKCGGQECTVGRGDWCVHSCK